MASPPAQSDILGPITKLEAGRRQLQVAIELWFFDQDPIAIHTLAHAAYEVIHGVSNALGRDMPLLWDSPTFSATTKKKGNENLVAFSKRAAEFFKHARNDPLGELDFFHTRINEHYIAYALAGLDLCGQAPLPHERAFAFWFATHRVGATGAPALKGSGKTLTEDQLAHLRGLAKDEFFHEFMRLVIG